MLPLREIPYRDADMLEGHGHNFNALFILGDPIEGQESGLLHISSAGSFVESSIDTRCFRIGDSKY